MNNRIDASNSLNFKARFLKVNNSEKVPLKIYTAIYKSKGVDEFLAAGQPKTFWQQVKDLFKKNEILTVDYKRDCTSSRKLQSADPFERTDSITFKFGKDGAIDANCRSYPIKEKQMGIPKIIGGEQQYMPPAEFNDNKLAQRIEELEDLDSLLK